MQFAGARTYRRRPSLTPMIDVVFLLLVFFMLASRFGIENVLPMPLASSGGDFGGSPRLIDIFPDALHLNGIVRSQEQVLEELHILVETPGETIIMRSSDGASVQRIISVSEALRQAGFTSLVLVE